ncbi:MAG TPA: hypothetical protein VJ436_04985 [Anaerolineales bacterium]|nr:hypothetical protein [Anaerolineales bacterium]
MMNSDQPNCLYCEQTSDQVPLLPLTYRGKQIWICPQHLPILIHKPAQLSGKLPGAEDFERAEGHPHS